MDAVKAMTLAQKVGRCLAATANAAHFDRLCLIDAQLPRGIDNAGADAVMAASFTERGWTTLILISVQPKSIDFGCSSRTFFLCSRCIGTHNNLSILKFIITYI